MSNINKHRLPDFFCLGVAKSGTTTLHHALIQHPYIFLPAIKETFFFSSDNNYKKGTEWYLEQYFSKSERKAQIGEIASTYTYHGERVARRLKSLYGQHPVKFIIVFRDPVKRAYSHYWHLRRLGWEKKTFRNAVDLENKRRETQIRRNLKSGRARLAYIESGLYASRIRPFLERFEREQFLFLLFEDITNGYDKAINRILKFLGLPVFSLSYEHRNEAKISANIQTMYWARSKRIKAVTRKNIPDGLRHIVGEIFGFHRMRSFDYPPLQKDLEAELREVFEPEVTELSKIIDRDLSHWLP
ncbi:MAG: hypothetical protein HON91_07890 [Anaerolineae bacterium]|nr:hypothetical protein [Anaerolineae bacterium]